jgi:hypothetical protein
MDEEVGAVSAKIYDGYTNDYYCKANNGLY